MIDYNTPPELPQLTMTQVTMLLQQMKPEDVRKFNEYCMIHFPNWLFKIIEREADFLGSTFENFVRIACINEVIKRVEQRKKNEANRNI